MVKCEENKSWSYVSAGYLDDLRPVNGSRWGTRNRPLTIEDRRAEVIIVNSESDSERVPA